MRGVEFKNVKSLVPYARNSRTHSDGQVAQIAASIAEFGFAGVIVIRSGVIAKGHGTVAAALKLYDAGHRIYPPPGQANGADPFPDMSLPVIDASGWSDAQFRAFVIADNKLAENAGWDAELLALELSDLKVDGFDLDVLGFTLEELSAYLDANVDLDGAGAGVDPDEEVEPDFGNLVSRPGDMWLMGEHRLICGDCTDAGVVSRLLDGDKPHLMVTDPPYGVKYDATWRDDRFGKADRAIDKVNNDDRSDWREAWALFPGDVAYIWHGGLNSVSVQSSLEACLFRVRSQIIWVKSNLVVGRGDFHWRHEPCFYAVRDGAVSHWVGGRKQTTTWRLVNDLLHEGEDVFLRRVDAEILYAISGDESTVWEIPKPSKSETGHSTQKPVECMRRPIANNSLRGDLVYEPFCGSGTTIIAGQLMGRRVRAVEIDPAYVDAAVRRWERFSGQDAILDGSGGLTFAGVDSREVVNGG